MVHRVAADGAQVVQGQLIGNVGEVGNASGPHLHYAQVLNGQEQHIVLHGEAVTYSFEYNGPPYTSYNCGNGTSNSAAESINGDKYDDLLAVDPNNVMQVYHGTANGTFSGPTRARCRVDVGVQPHRGGGLERRRIRRHPRDLDRRQAALLAQLRLRCFTKLANAGVGWNIDRVVLARRRQW